MSVAWRTQVSHVKDKSDLLGRTVASGQQDTTVPQPDG